MQYAKRWISVALLGWLTIAQTVAATSDAGKGKTVDVAMNKTLVTVGPYAAGQSIAYTLVVSNSSVVGAANVQVTDTPTNLTITNVSGGGCAALPCTLPMVTTGNDVTITVTATIDATGPFDNSATATANFDSNPSNNTDSTGNGGVAVGGADTSITKTLEGVAPFAAGQTLSYVLNVGNAGPATATNVQITDTPTNLTVTGVSGACTALPCTLPSLAAGANATIALTATINGPGPFDNNATVMSDEFDPDSLNNFDNAGNGGVAGAVSADVSITKALVSAGPYTTGSTATYLLTVTNAGPSPATAVQITDTPTNLTITNVGPVTCTAMPCTLPSLAAGESVNIAVSGTVNALGAFDNSATATAAEADPNPANNTDNAGNGGTATPVADVGIDKTLLTTGPYTIGQSVTYRLTVSNGGPSTATAVQVTDIPFRLAITGASGSGCTTMPCTIASLASGASTTIDVTATVQVAALFDNEAHVEAAEPDPQIGNNSDALGNGGTAQGLANLGVAMNGTTAAAAIGQTFTYTISVSNAGPSDANGVTVTDVLPAAFGLTSAPASQGSCSGTSAVTCALGTVVSGTTATVTLTGTVNAAGSLTNTASVTATEPDPVLGNNSATFVASAGAAAGAVVVPALDSLGWLAIVAGLLVSGLVAVRLRR